MLVCTLGVLDHHSKRAERAKVALRGWHPPSVLPGFLKFICFTLTLGFLAFRGLNAAELNIPEAHEAPLGVHNSAPCHSMPLVSLEGAWGGGKMVWLSKVHIPAAGRRVGQENGNADLGLVYGE